MDNDIVASDTRKRAHVQNIKFTLINLGLKCGPETDKASHNPPPPLVPSFQRPCQFPSTLSIQTHFQIRYPISSFSQPIWPSLPIATPNPASSDFMRLCTGYTLNPSHFSQPFVPRTTTYHVYTHPLNFLFCYFEYNTFIHTLFFFSF